MTDSYAILPVTHRAYSEIREKLIMHGYNHLLTPHENNGERLKLQGIALVVDGPERFAIGDVVRLKSGGPKMVVSNVEVVDPDALERRLDPYRVVCSYWNPDEKAYNEAQLDSRILDKVVEQ